MFLSNKEYLNEVERLILESSKLEIAVAFWGGGAENLLKNRTPACKVICNLLSGSTNPSVIYELISCGHEVKHLNTLHAKMVIGNEAAILGSANFSANGLSLQGAESNGWDEAGYLVSSEKEICAMRDWFSRTWDESINVDREMLKQAADIWNRRRRDRIVLAPPSAASLLDMPPSTLAGRDIVVAVFRDDVSPEGQQHFNSLVQEANDGTETKTWSPYEDWDELKVGQTVINVHVGKKGGITVSGPFRIFDVSHSYRTSAGFEGVPMTVHLAASVSSILGISSATARREIKKRLFDKGLEILPADIDGRAIALEDFVGML